MIYGIVKKRRHPFPAGVRIQRDDGGVHYQKNGFQYYEYYFTNKEVAEKVAKKLERNDKSPFNLRYTAFPIPQKTVEERNIPQECILDSYEQFKAIEKLQKEQKTQSIQDEAEMSL